MRDNGARPHLAENNKYMTINVCYRSELKETAPPISLFEFSASANLHDTRFFSPLNHEVRSLALDVPLQSNLF